MHLVNVVILAIVQGLAELLPVSSSAHVIVAEKLLGLDPTSPAMTLLLVLLHTGTMLAVIVYFWPRWRQTFFATRDLMRRQLVGLGLATMFTLLVGYPLIRAIETSATGSARTPVSAEGHSPHIEIEHLFGNLTLIAIALAAAGVLILIAGLIERRRERAHLMPTGEITVRESVIIGAVQGFCLPFRGFSRSGATISTALLLRVAKARAEDFSFALAVIITPPAMARELGRVVKAVHAGGPDGMSSLGNILGSGALGMVCSFFAGLVALRWLSGWLEHGRWYLFGIYCLVAALGVYLLHIGAGY